MTALAALLAAAVVLLLHPQHPPAAGIRLARLVPPGRSPPARGPRPARLSSPGARRGVAVFAGCCCAIVVGGLWGGALGLFTGLACDRVLRRLEPRASRRRRERLAADLPVAADLLAACLLSGATVVEAAESVAAAVGGPLAEQLHGVVASVRLGADPAAAWLALADEPRLAPLGRTVARAVDSGAPVADAMVRFADDQREEQRRAAAASAARVGVRAAIPLGVCFLPAFVLLGVLPVIGGIAQRVLGG